MGYTEPLRKIADGYNVHHIPENGGPTTNGVAHVDQWLGNGHWDIIILNFGLHDLKLDENGGHQVEIPEYEEKLKIIANKLMKTGARLIWVTTTPVPQGKLNPPRKTEDVAQYNQAAQRALASVAHGVCDLYSYVLPREAELQQKDNVHFTPAGYQFLAQQLWTQIKSMGGCAGCLNQ